MQNAATEMRVPHNSSGTSYLPEENPFNTVFVDLTHRCNMKCRNCYIPNRQVPDMDAAWLYEMNASNIAIT